MKRRDGCVLLSFLVIVAVADIAAAVLIVAPLYGVATATHVGGTWSGATSPMTEHWSMTSWLTSMGLNEE
jgi:hypothetical protein